MRRLTKVEYIDETHYKLFTDDGEEYYGEVIEADIGYNNTTIAFPNEVMDDYGVLIISVTKANSEDEPFDFYYRPDHDTDKLFATVWEEHGYEIYVMFAKIKELIRPLSNTEFNMSCIVAHSVDCSSTEATKALMENNWNIDKAIECILKKDKK
jgi:hypothetical protein